MRKIVAIVLFLSLGMAAMHAEDMNVTASPDGTRAAFTRDNDLWVRDLATGAETRLTTDGNDLILNGYASWVYYEEILGRPSKYKAFWWSPDSRRIGYYRFDNSRVPMFPIYSPFGQDGSLSLTRYPKAGETNPSVKVGIIDLESPDHTVWADFDYDQDQYFGIPFWGADSREFYVAREPRRQSQLDLYAVSVDDGSKRHVYHEEYPTWVNWIEGIIFTDKGLYFARDSRDEWEQIYFLSYDGKTFKCLSEGRNWSIELLKVDEKKGDIWFIAKRDNPLHPTLYRLDRKGVVTALTDPAYWTTDVEFSEDGKTFTARMSTACEPWLHVSGSAYKDFSKSLVVTKQEGSFYREDFRPMPKPVKIENDGFDLWGLMSLPKDFDPEKKYPVLMQLYGGPGTPYVRDRWQDRDASDRWCYDNGIIYIVVDPRSSGENGRRGMDQAFRQMTVIELQDYIAWAAWLKSLPYVNGSRIGVEGFSFGGTTTAMLVLRYPEYFACGVAGGGVYDWTLYDSHYTERFMDTPQANPDGYDLATVLNYVPDVQPRLHHGSPVLKLTHGTGDDNVHFQNTLQLIDALQTAGYQFDLMIYPDGMHGYRGAQHEHDADNDHLFWTRNLLN